MPDDKSIWKKEINLRRKGGGIPQATPPAKDAQPTSIWKKEIRLRKPSGTGELVVPTLASPAPAPQPPVYSPLPPAAPASSFALSAAPTPPVAPAPPASFTPEPPVAPAPPAPQPWVRAEPEPQAAPPVETAAPFASASVAPPEPQAPEAAAPSPTAFSSWPELEEIEDPAPQPPPTSYGWSVPEPDEPAASVEPSFPEPAPAASLTWDDSVEDEEPVADVEPDPAPAAEVEPEPAPATSFTWGEPEEHDEPVAPATPPTTYMPLPRPEPKEPVVPDEPEEPEPVARVVPVLGPVARPAFDRPRTPVPTPIPVPVPIPVVELAPEPETEPEPEAEAEAEPEATEPKPAKAKKKGRKDRDEKSKEKKHAATEVVGLRVGSSQLVAALVRNGHEPRELVQLARRSLDRGIVVAGEVREPAALAAALKAFFAENKLPRKAVRLGIASNRIGVRVLEVPAIEDPKLFDNAVRFRAQELLSIPINEAVLDHRVIGETVTDEGPAVRVLLAFAHRELIDRYVEACKRAKIKLVGIDFDAFALIRAVSEPFEPGTTPDRATVAVAIGRDRTIFAVSEGEVCDFTRVLDWGGSSLTVGVARALNLAPSEAEPIKQAMSFDGDSQVAELSPVQIEAARSAMKSELQVLARELLSSLQFYQSRPGSLAIGEILLAGGAAGLTGFDTELGRALGVPVHAADPYRRVTLGKKVKQLEDPGSVSIAVGLGIEA